MSRLEHSYLTTVAAAIAAVLALVAVGALLLSGLSAGSLLWTLLVIAAAASLTVAVSSWILAVAASKRLRGVSSALRDLARGELSAEVDTGSMQTEDLRTAFGELRARLHDDAVARDNFDRLLSSMSEAILVTDTEGRIERVNPATIEMLGYAEEDLLGKPIAEIVVQGYDRRSSDVRSGRPREGFFQKSDGETTCVSYTTSKIVDAEGDVECVVYCAQNIDDRKRVEQRIRYLARTDALTKIANRMQFQHLLQQGIARAHRRRQYLGLLYLDVDRFKDINDTFGHSAGDTSLEKFAKRIVEVLPEGAIPGRLAGDEFAVLLGGIDRLDDAIRVLTETSNRLIKTVGDPIEVHGEEIFMSTSIGIALYPRDGDNVVDLLRNADAALYQSKKAGGNCFEFYSKEMNTAAEERLMMKSKLRRAYERDELRVHYQPKYGLKSGRIDGAEALVRWDLPDHGLVFPADFIPLAEETNLILPIGDWVLNRVCADYRKWQQHMTAPCRVSVNLSLRQLQQQRFLEGVRKVFEDHGVAPGCLELEITETTLMEDTDRTVRILDSLHGMGLHLAIDDFGTGYSSLSALQQFPISTLKIDRSFVRDVADDADDAAIVTTIIKMAHSLNLEVVAEGVESQEQLDFLREHGCDYVQGHLFGDSVSADEFRDLLVADTEGSGPHQALFG